MRRLTPLLICHRSKLSTCFSRSLICVSSTFLSSSSSGTHKYSPSSRSSSFMHFRAHWLNDFSTEWDYLVEFYSSPPPIVCFSYSSGSISTSFVSEAAAAVAAATSSNAGGALWSAVVRDIVDSCCPLAEKGGATLRSRMDAAHVAYAVRIRRRAATTAGGTRENGKAIKARGIAIFLFVGLILLQIGPFWGRTP